jgi:hypothetical protein
MFEAVITDVKRGNFTLEQDAIKGMRATIKNNQTRLALEYAQAVIEELINYVGELEVRIENLETSKPKAARAAKTAEVDAE